jgi:hypothetical protein
VRANQQYDPSARFYDAVMGVLKRVALGFAALVAFVGYVWVVAVRALPGVRRRKAAARAARRR